jgi:hypothetical protein
MKLPRLVKRDTPSDAPMERAQIARSVLPLV